MVRRWTGVAAAGMGLWLVAAAAVLPAPALAAGWTWHLSAGAISTNQVGFTGALWAGSPTFEELFLRGGVTLDGEATIVDGGVAYLLTPALPGLAVRFPDLDPYVAAMLTYRTGAGTADAARSGMYAGVGGTYRLAERTWAWGELRLGSGLGIVVGLGVSL